MEMRGFAKKKELSVNVSKSRNFVIIPSTDDTKEDVESIWIKIEWKHAWNLFKE